MLRSEILDAVSSVISEAAFAGGPYVERFEREFAAYCGTKFAIGVGSGTEALWFALQALGIMPGDEVITTPHTFIATAEAITFCGAKPVFVDIDEKTYNIDPELIEAAITSRTRAIIPVHLYGQMADMNQIMHVARKHHLHVIEDASQSHGSQYNGQSAGSLGDVGCFSFYPSKNLGACGEAGVCVTSDSALRERIAMLREHGQTSKYFHGFPGWNGRMDGIQAAILSIKLRHLETWIQQRRRIAQSYSEAFSNIEDLTPPYEAEYSRHVYHLYVLRSPRREALIRFLAEGGIGTATHYPLPLHLQEAYGSLGYQHGSFPVAERVAKEVISLPLYPELAEADMKRVITAVYDFTSKSAVPIPA